ncbi:MAG TPA: TonB family protein [Candidatus Polarisedimenticolia bacterium]|nr:TonB family protein [Candidatus Polarisedimenticolia bacterium]
MSELGSLSQCMMDNDSDVLRRAQRLRRKALVASIFLEAAVLAALLLWPLITPGVLPPEFIFTPAPPVHGEPNSKPTRRPTNGHKESKPSSRLDHVLLQPPVVPQHAAKTPDGAPPSIEASFGPLKLPPGVIGGNNDDARIHIAPPTNAGQKSPRLKRSEGVMEASLIHRVQPEYPTIALSAHLSATVRLHAVIGTDGSVRHLEVVSGNPIFVPSAVAAIRQWRYLPTRLNGEAVEVETYITVEFVLR